MATKPNDDFDFEIEDEGEIVEANDLPEIDVEDDTPPEDRGREPLPKEIVEELENA